MANDLLRVENLSTGYGAGDVVRSASFSLHRGEICALLGENGSGKTTLLRAVCGLLPHRGSCTLDGRELRELTSRERVRRIGWLSQRDGADLPVSGLDVVLMGFNPELGALNSPTKAQRRRAMDALAALGAADLANADFTRLSAGQRQLLRLARATVREVDLLELDEPEGALDLIRRRAIFHALRERADAGCGVLLSCHDVNAALRRADRLLLMRSGQIRAEIDLRDAKRGAVETALRDNFGPVELIDRGGRWWMIEDED